MPYQSRIESLNFLNFMAWRNVWRNPLRSILTIFSLVAGIIIMIFYAGLLEGIKRQILTLSTETTTSHLQIHRKLYIDDNDPYSKLPAKLVGELKTAFPKVKIAPRLYTFALATTTTMSMAVQVKAIDTQLEPEVSQLLQKVKLGTNNLTEIQTNAQGQQLKPVIVGSKLAKQYELRLNDEVVLLSQAMDGSIANDLFYIEGILSNIDPMIDRGGLIMNIDHFRDFMVFDQSIHELALIVDDIDRIADYKNRIQNFVTEELNLSIDDIDRDPLVVRTWKEIMPALADMLELSQSMVWIVGFVICALASLGTLNTVLMSIHERVKEFGLLLAIGMKKTRLLSLLMLESFYIALSAALVGSLLGSALVHYFIRHPIDFSAWLPDGYDFVGLSFSPILPVYFELKYCFYASFLVALMTVIATLIPCWRLNSLSPARVIA